VHNLSNIGVNGTSIKVLKDSLPCMPESAVIAELVRISAALSPLPQRCGGLKSGCHIASSEGSGDRPEACNIGALRRRPAISHCQYNLYRT
jgi:hypothetical protein